jgi:hypothetical protein
MGVPGTGVEVNVGGIVAVGETTGDGVCVGAACCVAATMEAISAGDVPGMSAVAQADEELNIANITSGVRGRRCLRDITGSGKYTATVWLSVTGAM